MPEYQLIQITEKFVLEEFLKQEVGLHLYEIGDLDDFFWPHTQWFGLCVEGKLHETLLVYRGGSLATVLVFSRDVGRGRILLEQAQNLLPDSFYAHVVPGVIEVLQETHALQFHGSHLRMMYDAALGADLRVFPKVETLSAEHTDEIRGLYEESYPGNWFSERMLETGFYRGIREDERLVSIAGVHVFSRGQGVAALGNVTTLPAFRGRGFGMQVCSTLCCELQASVATIGLNVKSDNQKAIRVYQKLGFRECVTYEEYYVCRKESQDSLRPERK